MGYDAMSSVSSLQETWNFVRRCAKPSPSFFCSVFIELETTCVVVPSVRVLDNFNLPQVFLAHLELTLGLKKKQ